MPVDHTGLADQAAAGCSCWRGPVSLHTGHCCFRDATHRYAPDVPLPCGHDRYWHPITTNREDTDHA